MALCARNCRRAGAFDTAGMDVAVAGAAEVEKAMSAVVADIIGAASVLILMAVLVA